MSPHAREGLKLLLEERFQRAAEAFEKILALDPADRDAWLGLSIARFRLGDAAGAEASLRKLLAQHPADLGAQALLAVLRDVAGDRSALKALRAFAALPTAGPDVWHALGMALRRRHRWREAYRAFMKAAEIDPGDALSRLAVGALLLEHLDDPEGALEHLRQVAALVPDDYRAPLLMSRALDKTEEPDQAKAVLKDLVARFPDEPEVFGETVCFLFYGGNYSSMEKGFLFECVERWRQLEPRNAFAAYTHGRIHMEYIGFTEAKAAFALACALEADNVEYLQAWMTAAALSGHPEEAEEIAEKLQRLAPGAKRRSQVRRYLQEAKETLAVMEQAWGKRER